jgi:hypothetical protein
LFTSASNLPKALRRSVGELRRMVRVREIAWK